MPLSFFLFMAATSAPAARLALPLMAGGAAPQAPQAALAAMHLQATAGGGGSGGGGGRGVSGAAADALMLLLAMETSTACSQQQRARSLSLGLWRAALRTVDRLDLCGAVLIGVLLIERNGDSESVGRGLARSLRGRGRGRRLPVELRDAPGNGWDWRPE